ncbi:MAG TPA: UDP-N-acetylmuramate dehydrogenase [Pirellulaceae bacterium]|nr:UDP-N-acetylmuramate dehydrogenase [Pirellulaceae bacterium]HMO93513.1 UDP-N-acetylmuramate dehydrogenase [Pirellulaceae bacterium]HMP70418.1 UDP-N-acetylmuramate dehydrogenase [Pirellulaceae bacterium]
MSLIEGFENIIRENEPLAPYTSLRIGGVAEFLAEPNDLDQLQALVQRFASAGKSIRLLGGGSNVLVRDEGVAGLVILLSAPAFCQMKCDGEQVLVGGGVKLSHFVSLAVGNGFVGPENLVGIPGTVGGALHENTGVQGSDIGTWLRSADVMTLQGEIKTRKLEDLQFAYRESSLNELAILNARFEFDRSDAGELTRRMQKNWIVTKSNQPGIDQCSAYVFKDHGGESAKQLIERAGLKGARIGGVQVSNQHANFFIADPATSSDDVLRLIDLVRNQVSDRLDIDLTLGLQVW